MSTHEPTDALRAVATVVVECIPQFDQVIVESREGFRYAITSRTEGLAMASLREGMKILCYVTTRLPRVMRAEVVGPVSAQADGAGVRPLGRIES